MVSGMNFVHHISRGFQDIGCGYTPSITHTMAHELGHGIFGLDHIFSGAYGIKKGATYNLMDYTEKTPNDALSYHEWTQINLPLPSWVALSKAEEDMILKMKSTTIIEALKQSNEYGGNKRIVLQLGGWEPEYLSDPIGFNTDGFAYCKPLVDKRSGLFNYRVSCSSYSNFVISELSSELFVISSNYKERNFVNNDVIYKFEILEKKDKIFPIIPNECVTITLPSEMYRYFEAYVYGTELSVSEISEIRNDIAAMPSTTEAEKAAKEQAYLDLQWVVPYHSQRDNNTLDTVRHIITYVYDEKGKEIETKHSNFQTLDGKHSWSYDKCSKKGHANPCPNELKENVKAKIFWTTTNWVQKEKITYHKDAKGVNTDKIKEKEVTMYYKGKPGDIMCNLTSTAMNLTYLGLSKNDFDYTICPECSTRCSSNDQLEDFLDCVRKTKKMDSRLGYSTWRKLAELFGVSMTTKYSDPQKFNALNNQTFINEINGYLSSGKSIQMSVWPGCKGHIVRLVAISTEGIVVDDPYGDVIRTKTCGKKTPRQTGFMHRQSCNSGGYNKNTDSQSSIVGKHNLWKWDEIKDVTCKGIFIFDK